MAEQTRAWEMEIASLRTQVAALEKQVAERLSESDASIFHAHLMILQDQNFLDKLPPDFLHGFR